MKIGSLCSGYGGLELGVQAVYGGETAWVSDIDKGACKILAHRFPGVPNLGDMTAVDWAAVKPVDILTAGFPCQPVSNAGQQRGDQDERWLWDDVARAVGELRPGLVVLENVRGLLTAGAGRLFGRVLGSLAGLGYDAQWHGLRAADIGAPHGRWRIFMVATDASQRSRLTGVPRPDQRAVPRGDEQGSLLPTPRTSDTNGVGAHGEGGVDLRTAVGLLPTPRATDGTKGGPNPTPTSMDARSSGGGYNGQSNVTLTDATVRQTHGPAWGDYAAAIARWETVLGRPAPEPTMASSKGNPQLAPAFVEWMMGLPAGWVTDVPGITRNEALRALGNGIVPQQCEAALRVMASWAVAA